MVPRFRFAPSPTGILHVGNLHTALFTWALSRAMHGDFILRIDDTDEARNTPQAAQAIIDALTWLGLEWDEGPDVGGEYGPYVQSERLASHQQAAAALLAGGHAYYGDDPHNPASPENNPLRLRMPRSGETVLHDAIRGEIRFDNAALADPVLVRSNGRPLYHLASTVDDHEMGITHVVRGEEWIAAAPIHIHIHHALGWDEPVWVHLPLIRNRQGQKLKKRDPEGGYLISDFQEAGYLPQALFNYLLLLGWAPDDGQEILDKWQVRKQFRLERLSASPSTFDWDKLNWMNQQYLGKLGDKALAALIQPYLEDAYDALPAAAGWLERLTAVIRGELVKLEDAIELAEWALSDDVHVAPDARPLLSGDRAHTILARMVAEVASVVLLDEQTAHSILTSLQADLQQKHGWGKTAVFQPIRTALIGQPSGPPLPAVMSIIGKQRTLQRLANALR